MPRRGGRHSCSSPLILWPFPMFLTVTVRLTVYSERMCSSLPTIKCFGIGLGDTFLCAGVALSSARTRFVLVIDSCDCSRLPCPSSVFVTPVLPA